MELRAAAYQMPVESSIEANFERIATAIKEAARNSARILALPECALSGYPPHFYSSPDEIPAVEIAELNTEVARLAGEHGLWVVMGTVLMSSEGLLNSALVVDDSGNIAGKYDKLHLMPDDYRFFAPGFGVPLFEIDGVPFGIQICYDARFPEGFRYLRENGALLVFNISNACRGEAWKRPVLEGTYRTRASENSMFLVAVNACDPEQMATSRVCDPVGLDLAVAEPDAEVMLFADLDFRRTYHGYFDDRRTDQFRVQPLF